MATRRVQPVSGAVQNIGPLPAALAQNMRLTATAMGSPDDLPAGNGRPGTVIAQLSAISQQLQDISELLLAQNNLLERVLGGRH